MKEFRKEYNEIEICRNCGGKGIVCDEDDILYEEACDVCGGSGRINKHKTVIITIAPYNADSTIIF